MISKSLTVAFTLLASASFGWVGWYNDAYLNSETPGTFNPGSDQSLPSIELPVALLFTSYTNITPNRTNFWTYTSRVDIASVLYPPFSRTYDWYGEPLSYQMKSLQMAYRDVWAIDAARAVFERRAACLTMNATNTFDQYISFNYSQNKQNLTYIKALLSDIIPRFVDHQILSQQNNLTNVPYFTIEKVMSLAGAPTNYLEYAPWVELAGDGTNGMTGIFTQRYVQTCISKTDICTNYLADGTALYQTNGFIWEFVKTNAIESGRTHLDYGWKYMRKVITNLYLTNISGDMRIDQHIIFYQARVQSASAEWKDANGLLPESINPSENTILESAQRTIRTIDYDIIPSLGTQIGSFQAEALFYLGIYPYDDFTGTVYPTYPDQGWLTIRNTVVKKYKSRARFFTDISTIFPTAPNVYYYEYADSESPYFDDWPFDIEKGQFYKQTFSASSSWGSTYAGDTNIPPSFFYRPIEIAESKTTFDIDFPNPDVLLDGGQGIDPIEVEFIIDLTDEDDNRIGSSSPLLLDQYRADFGISHGIFVIADWRPCFSYK